MGLGGESDSLTPAQGNTQGTERRNSPGAELQLWSCSTETLILWHLLLRELNKEERKAAASLSLIGPVVLSRGACD